MWPIQLAFLLDIVCRIFLSLTLCHISHDRHNWSPSFFNSKIQNFPDISDQISELSNIQHLTKLCCTSNTVPFPSLHLNLLLVKCCFCHGNPGFNLSCKSCIFCCHATQMVEIFHILQLFLIHHNPYWGWLFWDFPYLNFFHVARKPLICAVVMPSMPFWLLGTRKKFLKVN